MVCSSFLIRLCMCIMSKVLLISSATVIVRAWDSIWLNPFATVYFMCRVLCLYPCCRLLKIITGTSWDKEKYTFLRTYNALEERSVANYNAPVWSIKASSTSFKNMQVARNKALRIVICSHLMDNINHIYHESDILEVQEHSEPIYGHVPGPRECLLVVVVEPSVRGVQHQFLTREVFIKCV